MDKVQPKLAVLAALGAQPDFSYLRILHSMTERETRCFLRWLDQSGLALYFFWQLCETGNCGRLPASLRSELERRMHSNRERTDLMLSDLGRLSERFRRGGIRHAFLKGFSLIPEFSPVPEVRHQTDIDILIAPEGIANATEVLIECGYSAERTSQATEMHFSIPLRRVPSARDDIYTADYQREVDLRTSLWDSRDRVRLNVPHDCLDRVGFRNVRGVTFLSLSQADICLFQLLHAFSHFLSSWIRLSWLWEIHYFLSLRANDLTTWTAIRAGADNDPLLRRAVGLILSLTNRLFGSPIPEMVRDWCIDPLPDRLQCWTETFGTRWALAEISGSKLSLFIHREFVPEDKVWRRYVWRRMVPFAGRPVLGEADHCNKATRARLKMSESVFRARRFAFHVSSLLSLSFDALRWKRSLNASASKLSGLKAREAESNF